MSFASTAGGSSRSLWWFTVGKLISALFPKKASPWVASRNRKIEVLWKGCRDLGKKDNVSKNQKLPEIAHFMSWGPISHSSMLLLFPCSFCSQDEAASSSKHPLCTIQLLPCSGGQHVFWVRGEISLYINPFLIIMMKYVMEADLLKIRVLIRK